MGAAAVTAAGSIVVSAVERPGSDSKVGEESSLSAPTLQPWNANREYEDALRRLEGRNPEAWKNAIIQLKFGVVKNMDIPQVERQAVLERLAAFVRDRAPRSPGRRSYHYCRQMPPASYPSEVELAIAAIGGRLEADVTFPINLGGINAAYAKIPYLDLRNVHFDGALLCRAILVNTKLGGATFRGANLRFANMVDAEGLAVGQLTAAASLQNVQLPSYMVPTRTLARMLITDPELSDSAGGGAPLGTFDGRALATLWVQPAS
jgi:hypothetical protein